LIISFRLGTKLGPEMPATKWHQLWWCIWTIQWVITEQRSPRKCRSKEWASTPSAYSPDINPFHFWAFGTIKWMIKDRYFQGPEEILRAFQEAQSHFTFEDFQNVIKSWMDRLIWEIANNVEYYHEKKSLGKLFNLKTLR
jgi:hypothetical protein